MIVNRILRELIFALFHISGIIFTGKYSGRNGGFRFRFRLSGIHIGDTDGHTQTDRIGKLFPFCGITAINKVIRTYIVSGRFVQLTYRIFQFIEYRVVDIFLRIIFRLVYIIGSFRIRNITDTIGQTQHYISLPDTCHLNHIIINRFVLIGANQRVGVREYRIAQIPQIVNVSGVNVIVGGRQTVVCRIFAERTDHQLVYLLPLIGIRNTASLDKYQLELRIDRTRSRIVRVGIHIVEIAGTTREGH